MSEWFYLKEELSNGPYRETQIEKLINEGEISNQTLVRSDREEDWIPAIDSKLSNLLVNGAGVKQCSECGQSFSGNDLIEIESLLICGECKPIFLTRLQEGKVTDKFFDYGGFWIRVGAKLIDGIILWLINLPIQMGLSYLIIGGFSFLNAHFSANPTSAIIYAIVNWIVSIGIQCTYSVFFITKKGATLGKMACGLKVINTDGSEKISFGKAIGRFFAEMLSGFTLGIGYIIAAFDSEKRALHDHICNTRVVKK